MNEMFTKAEIEMLEALSRFNKPGCLTPSELQVVRESSDEGVQPIPLGILRKAKSLLGGIHVSPILAGAGSAMIKLEELRKITHLFAYSSELDVFEESIERISVTIYMMWKVLRDKGLVTQEDLLNAAGVDEADLGEIDNLEMALSKAKAKLEEEDDGTDKARDAGTGSGDERGGRIHPTESDEEESEDRSPHGSSDRPVSGD